MEYSFTSLHVAVNRSSVDEELMQTDMAYICRNHMLIISIESRKYKNVVIEKKITNISFYVQHGSWVIAEYCSIYNYDLIVVVVPVAGLD